MASVPNNLHADLASNNQLHLLKFFEDLDAEQKQKLINELEQWDFTKLNTMYNAAVAHAANFQNRCIGPVIPSHYTSCTDATDALIEKYRSIGFDAIGKGQVCVMLVDGEYMPQGLTGMFLPGVVSGKSLFQLQAEKIIRIQELARIETGSDCVIPWYLMADSLNINSFIAFFKEHNYFGLQENNVVFFEQRVFPCFDFKGKLMMKEKYALCTLNSGSGSLFSAVRDGSILQNLQERGIKYIVTYSTENIVTKMADPVFIGFCLMKDADCAAKMILKQNASEKIGTFCLMNDKFGVIPTEEINPDILFLKKSESLVHTCGNISSYFLTTPFLSKIVNDYVELLPYHAIKSKFTSINESGSKITPLGLNGVSLKKYIHDAFAFSESFVLWDVPRLSEYSALKHTEALNKYNKSNPLDEFYKLQQYYIEKSGGFVFGKEIEISPLLSYEGEDLKKIVTGQTYHCPICLLRDDEKSKYPHIAENGTLIKHEVDE